MTVWTVFSGTPLGTWANLKGDFDLRADVLNDLEAALLDCWVPPPIEQSRPGMQITVLISFKRDGEMFGQPRIIFQSRDASDAERASYHTAVAETLKRCASLPFTEAFGNGMAGCRKCRARNRIFS